MVLSAQIADPEWPLGAPPSGRCNPELNARQLCVLSTAAEIVVRSAWEQFEVIPCRDTPLIPPFAFPRALFDCVAGDRDVKSFAVE